MAQAPMQGFNDWLAYQQSMMEKMSAVMTGTTGQAMPGVDLQGQAKALTDAWTTQTQRATEALAQMTKTWTAAAGGAGQAAPAWPTMPNLMDPALQDKVKAMFSQFGVALPDMSAMPSVPDAMLERLTKAPAFAHLFDLDQKLVGLMAAWAKLHTANLAYRTLVAKAWTEAQQAAFQKAGQAAMAAQGPAALDWNEGADRWLADLNDALVALMGSADYVKAQQQLHDAGGEVRAQLNKLGDEMAEWFQAPGRNEVDELAKSVAEMRKQLRRLTQPGAAGDEPAKASRSRKRA